jgi:DNA-binding transcriptional ArsR family regulator
VLDGGTAALLESLRPFAHWNPPYLDVDYPVDRELRLEGRGLTLVPSYFCWRRPTALADPGLDPVLVYPVVKQPLDIARAGEERLERLLGRTRSAVLVDVAGHPTRTTTQVAQALELAPASASYQIGVLRGAGLIVSRRDGKHVEHTATSLALNLLEDIAADADAWQRPCHRRTTGRTTRGTHMGRAVKAALIAVLLLGCCSVLAAGPGPTPVVTIRTH